MKIVKKIILWVTLSAIVQVGVLYYANNYIFSVKSVDLKVKKIVTNTKTKPKDADVKIPEGAEKISICYNGRYLAYCNDDKLNVVDTKTGYTTEVKRDEDNKVSYIKWLPDRNRLLIAEKVDGNFKLSYYDVNKNIKEDIKELTWADENSEVKDIEVSTLTNVKYIKVSHEDAKTRIYRLDIMEEMSRIKTAAYSVGDIGVIPHQDKLVYEDADDNRIYCTDADEDHLIKVSGVRDLKLISVDSNDNIYVGQVQDDKIVNIFSRNVDGDSENWTNIPLGTPVDKENIYVTSLGNIYVNDSSKGIVKNVKTGIETSYKGKLVQMYEKGILSLSEDNKVIKTIYK